MNLCKVGLHKWTYTHEGKVRSCLKCRKKQDKPAKGKWAESVAIKKIEDKSKYCQCPRDYTISIKSMVCQRCGLPRQLRQSPI